MRNAFTAPLLTLLPALFFVPSPAWPEGFRLRLPLACELGVTCFVQYYVDRDPGSGARDYACGSRSYDGHDGTDFRLPTLAQEAGPAGTVVAAAAGRVLRARNDAPDVSVRETGIEKVAGVECGNGLVVAHADGYETQYCHLARGSLKVRPGDEVSAGQPLGQAGLSGASEFPHLHFTLRRAGRTVDPFAPDAGAGACAPAAGPASDSLWEPALRDGLAYRAGTVLNAGFSGGPVRMDIVEGGTVDPAAPGAPALVAFVRTIGLDAGDVQSLVLSGPDGRPVAQSAEAPLARARAQSLVFVGRKRPEAGFPAGTYTATFRVTRAGATALEHRFTTTLPASSR
ncbi:M23 family metallopeptidase [Methylobacterium durans]|uniref:M23 family metallopeptidase n=1 Tax=Methylobacterium durans TaxID=2202825 RepID=UPI002B002294|nr:M23 family metallopeptidase [Methylobacterium durans]MEA1834363.1 M23 family metallopeptidase [Methylobacterium durans]